MSTGSHIRAARAWADISQTVLAERLGVEVQWVKRRESDAQNAREMELVAIAAACGVPAEFMFNGFTEQVVGPNHADDLRHMIERIEAKLDHVIGLERRQAALKRLGSVAAREAPGAASPRRKPASRRDQDNREAS